MKNYEHIIANWNKIMILIGSTLLLFGIIVFQSLVLGLFAFLIILFFTLAGNKLILNKEMQEAKDIKMQVAKLNDTLPTLKCRVSSATQSKGHIDGTYTERYGNIRKVYIC